MNCLASICTHPILRYASRVVRKRNTDPTGPIRFAVNSLDAAIKFRNRGHVRQTGNHPIDTWLENLSPPIRQEGYPDTRCSDPLLSGPNATMHPHRGDGQ